MRAILVGQRNRTSDRRSTGRGRPTRERHPVQRVAVFLGVIVMLGVICFHTELKHSHPAADSVLTESPVGVTLTYTTEVQLALSSVSVGSTSAGGTLVPAGALAYLSADRHDVLVLPLTTSLPPGGYIVSWRTAGPDGHSILGEFGFEVDLSMEEVEEGDVAGAGNTPVAVGAERDPATGESAQATEAGPSAGVLALATRFAFYAAIVGILGAIAFKVLVLNQAGRAGLPGEVVLAVSGGVWRIAVIAAALLLLTLPLRLWFQEASSFPGYGAGNLAAVITGTAWSTGWWIQGAAGASILLGGVLARPGRDGATGWKLVVLGALALPIVPLVSGHAWADSPRALSSVATYLHIVAASAWVGGLCCLVFAGLPVLRDRDLSTEGPEHALPVLVGAFSRLAMVAVGLLVASGSLKAWLHIGAPSDMWTTAWGRSLLVKDAVVLGVMALGFYNWRVVRPALASDPAPDRLRRSATLELLLGAAAVIATSFLVVQPLN